MASKPTIGELLRKRDAGKNVGKEMSNFIDGTQANLDPRMPKRGKRRRKGTGSGVWDDKGNEINPLK